MPQQSRICNIHFSTKTATSRKRETEERWPTGTSRPRLNSSDKNVRATIIWVYSKNYGNICTKLKETDFNVWIYGESQQTNENNSKIKCQKVTVGVKEKLTRFAKYQILVNRINQQK